MLKPYKILIVLLSILSFSPLLMAKNKENLLIDVIDKVDNVEDFEKIIPIVIKYPNILINIPSIYPIASKNKPRISSPFGKRLHPIDKKWKTHSGIDFVAEYATTIHATANGKVVYVGNKGGYGKCIIIEHSFGFKTIYAHLTEYYVKKNWEVKKGDIIAFLGNTGKSTGAHLHYEIRKNNKIIDPTIFLNIE